MVESVSSRRRREARERERAEQESQEARERQSKKDQEEQAELKAKEDAEAATIERLSAMYSGGMGTRVVRYGTILLRRSLAGLAIGAAFAGCHPGRDQLHPYSLAGALLGLGVGVWRVFAAMREYGLYAMEAPPEADRLIQELGGSNLTDARRLEVGVHLSKMGNPRPGVGAQNGVPEVDWVFVSLGGSVDIEGTRKTVAPFYLARYPVTYAQYEAFVKASDGFDNSAWWRDMPSKYTPPNEGPDSQRNTLRNAPRDNVSWYQAVAFTRWLTSRMKASNAAFSSGGARVNGVAWEVRLPTEWEWQWAAQGGSEKRSYPWGSWQDGRANAGDVLNTTTSVGMYPQGAAASGALDMSGNVWEWCLNKLDSPHFTAVYTTN
jgi:formylglycine-generating enzyme required for sulfatase activity